MITVDGHVYPDALAVPDFGSIENIKVNGAQRDYIGLEADFGKLPTYDDLGGGSTCMMLDSGNVYMYLSYNKTWYML